VLEGAETDEAGGNAGDHGGGFDGLAAYRIIGADDAERPRRRHTKAGHRFRTEKFADRGAQDGSPVGPARVRRFPRPLELDFPVAEIIAQAAEQMRPTIAQLPGPDTELMPGIDRGQRFRPRQLAVAGENFGEFRAFQQSGGQAEQLGDFAADTDDVRRRQRLRLEAGVKGFGQRREAVVENGEFERQGLRGVHGQLCQVSGEKLGYPGHAANGMPGCSLVRT
jgi:hypothetical protein